MLVLLTSFTPTRAWLSQSLADAERWLLNKAAQIDESMLATDELPNGIVFSQLLEQPGSAPTIVLIWRIADAAALAGVRSLLSSDDVERYFQVSSVGGPTVESRDDIVRPFLDALP